MTHTCTSMPELFCCNHLLGNREELAQVWREKGYWFFRGVLDHAALKLFAAEVLVILKGRGFVDDAANEPIYNGSSLENFPKQSVAGSAPFPEIAENQPWRRFLAEQGVQDFFTRLFSGEPYWVPVSEMRVVPPGDDEDTPFIRQHQDGFYNTGYEFVTAWIPLFDVPRSAGGLAVAEACHRRGFFHDTKRPPRFLIPDGAVPDESWRTTDYRAGDVIIFDRYLPHSGMRNRTSDRFRVSFDGRGILPGAPKPVIGTVERATEDAISVRERDGSVQTFCFNVESYCRSVGQNDGFRIAPAEVPTQYSPGLEVMLTHQEGVVCLLRQPTYGAA